jgi:nucleoside-diphosphate-sugar epimerase
MSGTAADAAGPEGIGTVAVLGATGCVGRSVRAAFVQAGWDVLSVARNRPNGPDGDHAFETLDVAATAPERLARILTAHRVRVVVNATGGWLPTDEANEYHHVSLVENLLAATARMPRTPRLVQVGSIHEYGPTPPGSGIDEDVPPRPVTGYARTKLAGSRAVLRATRTGLAAGVVLRAVNVSGPHVPPASFLGSVVERLRTASPARPAQITIGDARRDYVDVRDLAAAVVCAATAPVVGQVFNIGRGEAVPIRDLLSMLFAASGLPPAAIRQTRGPVTSKGGDWTRADIRRAQALLDWRPRIALRQSIQDMWDQSLLVRSRS